MHLNKVEADATYSARLTACDVHTALDARVKYEVSPLDFNGRLRGCSLSQRFLHFISLLP